MELDLNLLAKDHPVETIREHTDCVKNNAKGLEKIYHIDEKTSYLLDVACEYHDYGKVSQEFQNRIKTKQKYNKETEIPHNLLSIFFIDAKLFKTTKDYYSVVYAVLNHHYNNNYTVTDYLREKRDLVDSIVARYGKKVKKRLMEHLKDPEVVKEKETIIVKGLLHRCDYAASAHIPVEYPNDFLQQCMERWITDIQKKNETAQWNALQKYCESEKNENVIVTAPTGMGKTEAALLWLGNQKGIYILPLRSAINGIFDRIEHDILQNQKIDERLGLSYSDNVNYLLEQENTTFDVFEYKTKVRQFTMPITISTPDQLFDFVFRVPGYEMKLATAAYSKIIIDEIQAYDATLLAYIIYGIHQIMDIGGKVAILTATLPDFVKAHLLENQHSFVYKNFSSDRIRHNLQVVEEEMASDYILDIYEEKLKENGTNKTLVICNTVKKAQEIYQQLVDANFGNVEIKILHAKYIRRDRKKLETEIQEDGKTDCLKNVIWVTTQIVEASLDIDFDYLCTELSDLNGLFQRLGRCNRKGFKSCEKTNCYVFTEINPKTITSPDGKKGFIDERLYTLSKEALIKINGKISEYDKNKLIVETFSEENMKGSLFQKKYRDAYQMLEQLESKDFGKKDVQLKFRNIVSYFVIPRKIYEANHEEIDCAEEILKKRLSDDSVEIRNQLLEQKQRAKNKIMNYVVSVGMFDLMPKLIVDHVSISDSEQLSILDCNYDEKGFMRLSKEQMDQMSSYNLDYGCFL